MSRLKLIKHIESHGCYLLREGGRHSVYVNPANGNVTAIPRHREINDFLSKDLQRSGHSRTLAVVRLNGFEARRHQVP